MGFIRKDLRSKECPDNKKRPSKFSRVKNYKSLPISERLGGKPEF